MTITGTRLKMMAGASYIPNNNQSNEDAHFICLENNTIGLSDGTTTWPKNSGEYPHELMANSVFSICHNYREGQNVDPILVLNQAFANTRSQGSSTALILALKNCYDANYLHAANLGDNGFLLLRGGKIVYESPAQKSKFSSPCQLGESCMCSLSSAMELMVPVKCGDIVVAGTNGLFDNVYGYEIEILEQMFMEGRLDSPEVLAEIIAEYALKRAEDDTYFSPFQRAAMKAGFDHVGGKSDDINVVVAYIFPED